MDVLVVGCGNIGLSTARALSRSYDVVVVDVDRDRLRRAEECGLKVVKADVLKDDIPKARLACVALPGSIAYNALRRLVRLGFDVVDVSYFPEDPFALEDDAVGRGRIVVVDAGLAPGLSNVLVPILSRRSCRIYVGGISADPNAPLGLAKTWNLDDLLDEYVRPARMIVSGEVVSVDPLEVTGEVEIPGFGRLEYFASDGLRTMLKTLRMYNLAEFTLRRLGHVSVMRTLKRLGFLSTEVVQGCGASLRSLLASRLERELPREDIVILYVVGDIGWAKLIAESSEETAMARTTSSVQSAIASMILEGRISGSGVLPPEMIGMNKELADEFLRRFYDLSGLNIELRLSGS